MESRIPTPHHVLPMRETPQPRRVPAAIALALTALSVVVVYLLAPDDPGRRPPVINLLDSVAWFMGGVVLLTMREGRVARSARAVGFTLLIGAAVIGLVFVSGLFGSEVRPGFADLLFLVPLIPLVAGFRSEIRHHVPPVDRRELATDAALIVTAVMAASYILILPVGADRGTSASAVTFSLVTALNSGDDVGQIAFGHAVQVRDEMRDRVPCPCLDFGDDLAGFVVSQSVSVVQPLACASTTGR